MNSYSEKAEATGRALAKAFILDHPNAPPNTAYYMGWAARGGWDKTNPKMDPELLEQFIAAARKVLRRNCTDEDHQEADRLLHKLEGRDDGFEQRCEARMKQARRDMDLENRS